MNYEERLMQERWTRDQLIMKPMNAGTFVAVWREEREQFRLDHPDWATKTKMEQENFFLLIKLLLVMSIGMAVFVKVVLARMGGTNQPAAASQRSGHSSQIGGWVGTGVSENDKLTQPRHE